MENYAITTIQPQDRRMMMEWMSPRTLELIEEAMSVGDGSNNDVVGLAGAKMVEDLHTFLSLMSRLLSYREYSQSGRIRDDQRCGWPVTIDGDTSLNKDEVPLTSLGVGDDEITQGTLSTTHR